MNETKKENKIWAWVAFLLTTTIFLFVASVTYIPAPAEPTWDFYFNALINAPFWLILSIVSLRILIKELR